MKKILLFFLIIGFSVSVNANHAIVGTGSGNFSKTGNGSVGLSSGDTILIQNGTYTGYCIIDGMNGLFIMPYQGLVKFTNTLEVSNNVHCVFDGTIISGTGGVTDSRSSIISQMAGKTCGFMWSVTTGNTGCLNFGGTSTHNCKFRYLLNTGSTQTFYNLSGGAWTGPTSTKLLFQDTFDYCWSRNSGVWCQKGPTGNNNAIMDSCIIQHQQEDSTNVIVGWNFLAFHSTWDNIYCTAMNPTLLDDGLDEGWFMMSNCMGGSTMSNIRRIGPHWGYLARIGCAGYDFLPFKMFNVILDYTITYALLDLRGADTAFLASNFPVTGFTWHCPQFSYVYNCTNGNNSNARTATVGGYITSLVWYGNWNPNGGSYFYNLAQFHHTQYSSYPDSISVFNFSNPPQPTLFSVVSCVYNANGLNFFQDTTTTWKALVGGPLIGTGTNSPIAQGTDIYSFIVSSLIGAAGADIANPCNCLPHKRYYGNVFK